MSIKPIETVVAVDIPNFISSLRSIIYSASTPPTAANLTAIKTLLDPAATADKYVTKTTTLKSTVSIAIVQSSQTTAITLRNELTTALDELKTAIEAFITEAVQAKLEDIKSKFNIVDSKYTSLSGALQVIQASSASRPTHQTSNDKFDAIKNIIRVLYDNYFLDNKEVVSYLANINNIDGNEFSRVSKYILKMNIPYLGSGDEREYLFHNNAAQPKSVYMRYQRLIKTILLIAQTLNHMYSAPNASTAIDSISITKVTDPLKTATGTNPVYEPNNNNTAISYYAISGNTLNIYYIGNDTDYVTGFSSATSINKLIYDSGEVITEYQILSNYIIFMMRNLKPYNVKKQIQAFYFYIYVLNECFKFYFTSEKLIAVKQRDQSTCDIFNPGSVQQFYMTKLYKITDFLVENNNKSDSTRKYTVTGKFGDLCPINVSFDTTLTAANRSNFIHDYQLSTDEYLAKVTNVQVGATNTPTNKEFAIESFDYIQNTNKENQLIGLTLKAGANVPDCEDLFKNDNSYVLFDTVNSPTFTNDSNITIEIVKRSQDNLRKDYYEVGSKLQDLNTNIEKSKDKINAQVKNYDMQTSILKALDTRKNIYYAIFAIVLATIIVLLLLDLQQSVKMYISLTIALILLIVNIINYYMKYDYIEQFSVIMEEFNDYMTSSGVSKNNVVSCTQINEFETFNTRIDFVKSKIPALTAEMLTIFQKLNALLIKNDAVDMFSKLSSSLQNEKRNYEDQAAKFKHKEDANKKSIDIMKHEMIEKTGYINLMSVTFLVIVLVYILYIIDPTYLSVYLTIAIILTLVNLIVYYIIILHPVRTMARNKYWMNPSKSVLQQTS